MTGTAEVVERVMAATDQFGLDWAEPDPLTAVRSARHLASAVDEAKLADTTAQVAGLVGGYEGMGEPFTRGQAEYTVVEVPLRFEAGDMAGRVVFHADGKVAGLFVLRPEFA